MSSRMSENKYNNHETVVKVAYMFGIMQDSLNEEVDNLDWEDIASECEAIAIDWINFVDIQDYEEEGYVMKYAERKLIEKFGKKD